MSAIAKVSQGLDQKSTDAPEVKSFRDFLENHARAKGPGGEYVPYSFKGREALIPIIETFDLVLGSHTGSPLPDATVDICGGAQFGKTILALNFGAYLTACRFFNWGYYLPDDDLVEGIVDTKLRPDILEQIEWLGPLMSIGKVENARGKIVNRKGAFQVSDGARKAFGMIRGMGKIPTSFSMDCAMEDEKDDIPAKRSKYLTGRLTASDLRLRSSIGTQRLHGAGQQKCWEDGSQGIFEFGAGDRMINLEENWPQICRMQLGKEPSADDPKLTQAADFRDEGGASYAYDPAATYYFADPDTGAVIDRSKPVLRHLRPERIKLRRWSFRISQFAIGALAITQFVSRYQEAVRDPDTMIVFRCDVMALPANNEQALSPEIIHRARTSGEEFDLSLSPAKAPRFAGLDTGNRCWFLAREVRSEAEKRIQWAEQIPISQVVSRTIELAKRLGISCLAIDANPHTDQARQICYALNGFDLMDESMWRHISSLPEGSRIEFPGGVVWDGKAKAWENLRAFVVEFNLKPGQGLRHKLGKDPQTGFDMLYPSIEANRFESIGRVVNEFLTPTEEVFRVVDGQVLQDPIIRLPRKMDGSPPVVGLMDAHFLTGSKREKKEDGEARDFVDGCENHLLLADAYSALAEMIGGRTERKADFHYTPVTEARPEFRRKGGGL